MCCRLSGEAQTPVPVVYSIYVVAKKFLWGFGYTRTTIILTTYRGRGLSKLVISRVIIRVTPFRALITLLITYLLSPLPLQVEVIRIIPTSVLTSLMLQLIVAQ